MNPLFVELNGTLYNMNQVVSIMKADPFAIYLFHPFEFQGDHAFSPETFETEEQRDNVFMVLESMLCR